MNCRPNFSRCKNNARFNSPATSAVSSPGLLFKIQRNFANPRKPQANRTPLRSPFWRMAEKHNFLRHDDSNNALRVSINPQNGADAPCPCCSPPFEQIINTRCTSVSIKLVLRFVDPNEFQQKYCPVKVGFLKAEVKNPSLLSSPKHLKMGADHSPYPQM